MIENPGKGAAAGTGIDDALAALASAEIQRKAADTAQDAFAHAFRLMLQGDEKQAMAILGEIEARLRAWCATAPSEEGRSLYLALVASGMDQWGLAYSQAFGLHGIPALSHLLGSIRNGMEAQAEARFQKMFAAIDAVETNAVDFKVALRRGIHMALWSAMISCESREEAERILATLGSLLVALIERMPVYGWRLVADAMAQIQIRCVAEGLAADGLARDVTEALFDSVAKALPKETRDQVFVQSGRAVVAWQQARRAAAE